MTDNTMQTAPIDMFLQFYEDYCESHHDRCCESWTDKISSRAPSVGFSWAQPSQKAIGHIKWTYMSHNGVPMEYLSSVDQTTIRENNDAEDMIDEVKIDNHEDRKTNDDDVDSEVMQGEAGTNDNDHEDSVLDDASCKVN